MRPSHKDRQAIESGKGMRDFNRIPQYYMSAVPSGIGVLSFGWHFGLYLTIRFGKPIV